MVDSSTEKLYAGLLSIGDEILEVNGEKVACLSLDQEIRFSIFCFHDFRSTGGSDQVRQSPDGSDQVRQLSEQQINPNWAEEDKHVNSVRS
ncbi:uncharacterized protein AKAME5_001998900 [Lates japonicus]|uniref:PDZ domain-containing protein n=1 Tax=Lates japonicus TaxID=270547 RepID=A0AAD3NCA0_LATJO|nr:uncharacterized protein AKAME5_001998900 [Lates japonicus]